MDDASSKPTDTKQRAEQGVDSDRIYVIQDHHLKTLASQSRNSDDLWSSQYFCKEFRIGKQPAFLIYQSASAERKSSVNAYLNSCPHRGIPLNWQPDMFLDEDSELIHCSSHGARFRVGDGFCVSGPCAGQSLTALKTTRIGGAWEISMQSR